MNQAMNVNPIKDKVMNQVKEQSFVWRQQPNYKLKKEPSNEQS